MLKAVRSLLQKWIRPASTSNQRPAIDVTIAKADDRILADEVDAAVGLVAYDENLLENSRIKWQFGDWKSLAQLDRITLQHHPDRAKLALLAAAGHQALGDINEAGRFTRLAMEWGCGKKFVSQILIAGVHNTLGKAAASGDDSVRALRHFTAAIETGAPASPAKLLTEARARHQLEQLGLVQPSLPGAHSSIGVSPVRDSYHEERAVQRARETLKSDDVHSAVDALIESEDLTAGELVLYFVELSDRFAELEDKLTALHFLDMARKTLPASDDDLRARVVKRYISLGKAEQAADITVRAALRTATPLELDEAEKAKLLAAYDRNQAIATAAAEHGHELLIAYLNAHIAEFKQLDLGRPMVMVEIGSTRENVPGQGSTAKLAEFCRVHGLHFVTVDMDPHNTRMAEALFGNMGVGFKAINMKGEEYLRQSDTQFDFVFLDAYDFDHGGHSALRQSRYEKFLGTRIDDAACHQMHFDCATSVVEKLPAHGLVCIDDTWLEEGQWTAKGTLAMPYFLEQGYRLLEARNRASLLAPRGKESGLV